MCRVCTSEWVSRTKIKEVPVLRCVSANKCSTLYMILNTKAKELKYKKEVWCKFKNYKKFHSFIKIIRKIESNIIKNNNKK